MTMYEITEDMKAIYDLLSNMVDDEGNPRDPTPEEMEYLQEQFILTNENFEKKFDGYCRLIKNLEMDSKAVDGERKAYKDEMDRLSKRAKAFENRAKNIKGLLRFSMENLKLTEHKNNMFSAKIQNTQLKVEPQSTINYQELPFEYLKCELDTTKIKQDLKDGLLIQKGGAENYGKVFTKEGQLLKGVSVVQGQALYIR